MGNSFQKACFFITALALSVIAVELIPFSREKDLSNSCREYLAIRNSPTNPEIIISMNKKGRLIASKAKISTDYKVITKYCNSFY